MRVSRFPSAVIAALVSVHVLAAQTVIKPPKNKYTTGEDVQLGREAATQVEQQLPNPPRRQRGIVRVGYRTAAWSRRFRPASATRSSSTRSRSSTCGRSTRSRCRAARCIVNRGMIEAAKTEGEVAGVMAHEISHVALRHGTAQATKATKYEARHACRGRARRDRRRANWKRHRAGYAVRSRGGVPAIQPRIRKAGRPRGLADHGARGVRPARDGEHVQDDRAAGRVRRSAVAERSPEPRRSLQLHSQGGAVAAGRERVTRRPRLRDRQGTAARDAACADDRRSDEECREPRPFQRVAAAARRSSPGTWRGRRRASRRTPKEAYSASACPATGAKFPATTP